MNRLRFATHTLALLSMGSVALAHGGLYRGPGGPGSGAGPDTLGPLGPTAAGNAPGSVAPGTLGGGGAPLPDLTQWGLWWRQNQAPYLALKEHIHSLGPGTGTGGWYLGDGQRPQASTLRPTEDQIQKRIVPVLLAVLERETNNDLVTGAMVALAKIGVGLEDDAGESGDAKARAVTNGARLEAAIVPFLDDASQEVRETAAVSLGILASPRSIPTLAHLLWDTREGRKTARTTEVDYRTRSFAAYGLGLIGARTRSELDRQLIVSVLRRALEGDDTRSRDLGVACVVALGLVPLATVETPVAQAWARRAPPETSRRAQIDYVLAILREEKKREHLLRAQCPVTLARLLEGLPEPQRELWRAEVAGDLLERLERERDRVEVLQSCILALGQMGTNDGKNPLDSRIRRTLAGLPRRLSEPQARAYALVAAGEVGARFGQDLPGEGIEDVREFLVDQLAWGKNALQPWAGLAGGVLCRRLQDQGIAHPALDSMRRVLRAALEDERSPEQVGAYALAAGLARSQESAPRLMKLLAKELQDEARGQVALGLALLGHEAAIEPLREIVGRSKYHPELLSQGAIALAILGDKDIGAQLAGMLADARSVAAQAAIASALGFVGDSRVIEPLLTLLGDQLVPERSRAFAAVALGNVADKEPLPWNAKIGVGINYRAAPATLSDPLSGTGVLDIF